MRDLCDCGHEEVSERVTLTRDGITLCASCAGDVPTDFVDDWYDSGDAVTGSGDR